VGGNAVAGAGAGEEGKTLLPNAGLAEDGKPDTGAFGMEAPLLGTHDATGAAAGALLPNAKGDGDEEAADLEAAAKAPKGLGAPVDGAAAGAGAFLNNAPISTLGAGAGAGVGAAAGTEVEDGFQPGLIVSHAAHFSRIWRFLVRQDAHTQASAWSFALGGQPVAVGAAPEVGTEAGGVTSSSDMSERYSSSSSSSSSSSITSSSSGSSTRDGVVDAGTDGAAGLASRFLNSNTTGLAGVASLRWRRKTPVSSCCVSVETNVPATDIILCPGATPAACASVSGFTDSTTPEAPKVMPRGSLVTRTDSKPVEIAAGAVSGVGADVGTVEAGLTRGALVACDPKTNGAEPGFVAPAANALTFGAVASTDAATGAGAGVVTDGLDSCAAGAGRILEALADRVNSKITGLAEVAAVRC
jgi:hypothetical protein